VSHQIDGDDADQPKVSKNSRLKYDPSRSLKELRKKKLDEWDNIKTVKRDETRGERDFHVHRSKKLALFEGISFVPYDYNLRQDIAMQNVLFRDLLKILLDKCKTLKLCLQDTPKIDRVNFQLQ
jgi:hypothetical protein